MIDITIALVALTFLLPLLAVVAMMVLIDSHGPVLFGHHRIGLGGRTFRCLKFRSMATDAEARLTHLLANDERSAREWRETHKLTVDPRVTRIGRFLRRSSLDELPQLFNVLKGEMSIVGPRPIVRDEIGKYGRYYRDYCRVTPGITGLWQISGRSDLTYRRRVALDVVYCRSRSVALDMKILALTVPAVFLARGSR